MADDYMSNTQTEGRAEVGGLVAGEIEARRDVDGNLIAGTARGHGGTGSGGSNAQVDSTATESGTCYCVSAGGNDWPVGFTGRYTLSVRNITGVSP